jgi:hypothetical protein
MVSIPAINRLFDEYPVLIDGLLRIGGAGANTVVQSLDPR